MLLLWMVYMFLATRAYKRLSYAQHRVGNISMRFQVPVPQITRIQAYIELCQLMHCCTPY